MTHEDDKAFLPLALVPLERATDRLEPVDRLCICTNGRERVLRGLDPDVVALFFLQAQLADSAWYGTTERRTS